MQPVSGTFRSVVMGSVVIVRMWWKMSTSQDGMDSFAVTWTPVRSQMSVSSFFEVLDSLQATAQAEAADRVTISTDGPSILPDLLMTAINYRQGRVHREEIEDMVVPKEMPRYFGYQAYGNRVLATLVLQRLLQEETPDTDVPRMLTITANSEPITTEEEDE